MPFQPGKSGNPSGRPKTRDKHAGAIARAEKQIADKLPTLIDRALELAEGVTVKEIDKDGGINIYTKPPDRQAIEYLVNRIMGKPTERQETDLEGGLTIKVEYADVDSDTSQATPEPA